MRCGELAGFVKKFLAACPSSSEEERFAFQSIKKLLPPSCKCQEDGFVERLVEGMLGPSPLLPDGYLAFVRRIAARELFPPAWDTTYVSECYLSSPPLSSCLEGSRREGGQLGNEFSISHEQFLASVLGTRPPWRTSTMTAPMVVQSAGKPRPLTKFSSDTSLLRPLHKAMYNRLSCQRWLCRGDPSRDVLSHAGFRSGLGSLVSGDYVSATDNLPLVVAEAILDVALSNASRVPESLAIYARSIMRPQFYWAKDAESSDLYTTQSGQQMGSLLCFPLLCAQNYLAFRWALRSFRPFGVQRFLCKDVPVLINGDDILFQADDPRFYDHWVRVVSGVGLQVEATKTSVSDEFGSLNSTLFRWKGGFLSPVPTLRFGLLKQASYPCSLASSFVSFTPVGLAARVRFQAARQFFRWHRPLLLKSSLSLAELGFFGRLSWRAGELEGVQRCARLRMLDRPEVVVPRPPCPHNVVLDSALVEWVPSLRDEERLLSAREMTSWKWRLVGTFRREKVELSFWMALSRPSLDWSRLSFREGPYWRSLSHCVTEKMRHLHPRRPEPVKLPFFAGLDRLPQYEEVPVEGALEVGRDHFGIPRDFKAKVYGLPGPS